MARVPWVERAFGQDRLARWHRLVGFTSFCLMLAHVVLITSATRSSAHVGVLAELWRPGLDLPGHAARHRRHRVLVMVVVTSVRAARRRLRYESWHLLHLYAYLGVGLALPHQLWTGTDFVSSTAPPARTGGRCTPPRRGAVLVYRIGLPLWRTLRHRWSSSRGRRGGARRRLGVPARPPAGPAARRAGQFFVWRFLDGPGWSRAHPYSLSAPPPRRTAAHHREGPRRRQPAAGRPAAGHPGARSRARTAR